MAELIVQLALNTLALAAAYALVALGFVLVINAVGAVNFAHGELVVAGGFIAVLLGQLLPWPGALLAPFVLALTAALGIALSLLAYFPLRRGPPVGIYVSTIAVGIMLQNAVLNLFGPAPRRGPPLLDAAPFRVGDVAISSQALATIAAAAALVLGLHLMLARTQLGRRLRATAQDRLMAESVGIDTRLMIALSFALAAMLAGAAGLLLAPLHFMAPHDGAALILKAYVATVIGGWGRLHGALLGAGIVAAFEIVGATLLSQPAAEAALYLALLAMLWLKPEGLFGEATGRRA
ncbi:MAG: branched-chain amino acid ABC transporter permease [Reyranellaceae bacterium]